LTGLISATANQPIDVIKTNMQGLHAHKYKGVADCISQTWHNEGFLGFYKGLRARLFRVMIEVAGTFVSYNFVKKQVLKFTHSE